MVTISHAVIGASFLEWLVHPASVWAYAAREAPGSGSFSRRSAAARQPSVQLSRWVGRDL